MSEVDVGAVALVAAFVAVLLGDGSVEIWAPSRCVGIRFSKVEVLRKSGISDAEEYQSCEEYRLMNEVNGKRVSPQES